ncbi:16S rRNA (adenine(1518)-N(6)/adenine(1519)-N(6))-dimethyltransferase RsmA [Candidatus Venteria ishoeyi]|uniref:16S rRNA (adenine(1518)-N(6)/adenine(1519)-N(6))- dimethyltransferase RsmA n=1 Tax=Candidatus Venteria ishoeyi TaxID=1899563 RepID=UPI0025A5B001|nr:16S rRNA (adenine(1518)-N(6)/adenine(1519)-N(6))-dimethyltransferase RsmA [Candidatus Venteria ishoeyi]MDM8545505.1 16S rRNA (adenine(1518)-N(6)/adenine(1519)-N(6))-dimethyltransferase RsmA [Candidatus Venteria ishoeyi]
MNFHTPRKRFGQNFLHDPNIIRRIVQSIAPQTGQDLVEIGPGMGALTDALLLYADFLNVVELDRNLVDYLQKTYGDRANLKIHQADALKFDFCDLKKTKKLRIIGNLPYNISTPLLFHLMQQLDCIEDMVFMLQKEVVMRMAAHSGNKCYGRLSVMLQYYCQITPLFDVPRGAFKPAPKVESTIVSLRPHASAPVTADPEKMSNIVGSAFSQRRKTLRNSLKGLFSEQEIASANIDPGLRAENLTLEDFAKLSLLL